METFVYHHVKNALILCRCAYYYREYESKVCVCMLHLFTCVLRINSIHFSSKSLAHVYSHTHTTPTSHHTHTHITPPTHTRALADPDPPAVPPSECRHWTAEKPLPHCHCPAAAPAGGMVDMATSHVLSSTISTVKSTRTLITANHLLLLWHACREYKHKLNAHSFCVFSMLASGNAHSFCARHYEFRILLVQTSNFVWFLIIFAINQL